MDNRKVVLYMRLSIEDGKSGSMSLENQKKILEEKLLNMPEYEQSEVLHLVDNGHSGTTFDRPALNTMMDLVKQRAVSCILIKDFSRLGRDMLQVGYLTESVFPLFYTRLVAVNENFDSNNHYESTGGLDVTFRYLMAETYSKDLGKKISAVRQSKIKNGELVVKNPFYGYKLDKNRKYAIDTDVEKVIHLIFDLALQGLTLTEIKSKLYSMKIPTPATHRSKDNSNYHVNAKHDGVWSITSIGKILHDVRYTGVYTAGYYKSTPQGNIKTEEKDRPHIENHHPAIIEKEKFDKVQKLLPIKSRGVSETHFYPLKSKLYCGVCGRKLTRVNARGKIKFQCPTRKIITGLPCSDLKIIGEELFETTLARLKKEIEALLQSTKSAPIEPIIQTTTCDLAVIVETLKQEKKKIYEMIVNGKMNKADFIARKKEIDLEIEKASSISKTGKLRATEITEQKNKLSSVLAIEKELEETKVLTFEIGEKYINKVIVFPDGKLKFEFLFTKLNDSP